MCISPINIKRQYRRMAHEVKNGKSTLADTVPCGKCHECLGTRRNAWAFRLWKQMDIAHHSAFVTLTYAEEPLSPLGHGTLRKKDVQDFIKRLRKREPQSQKIPYEKCDKFGVPTGKIGYKSAIKYYCCGEYGSRYLRPHYHLIMYNLWPSLLSDVETLSEKIWGHGSVDVAVCNMATINYTVGYIMKGAWKDESEVNLSTGEILVDDRQPEFSTMSKNLGLNYLSEKIWSWHVDNMIGTVTMQNGSLLSMPRYYKEKVFSKEEREELAQEAKMIRDIPLDYWNNFTVKKFYEKRDNSIRKHEKEQLLKRLKL